MKDLSILDQHPKELILDAPCSPENGVIILSSCRSGSTALLNAFYLGGWDVSYQPIKTALRRQAANDPSPVVVESTGPNLAIKEAFGPFLSIETDYDPVAVLKQAGFSPRKLHLIFLLRRPEDCLRSWIKGFEGNDFTPVHFGTTYDTMLNLWFSAAAKGISRTILRCEDLGNQEVMASMMAGFGLEYKAEMIDWTKSERFQIGKFGFELTPPSQDIFKKQNAHNTVLGSSGLSHEVQGRLTELEDLPTEICRLANLQRAKHVYAKFQEIRGLLQTSHRPTLPTSPKDPFPGASG
jgi:hypothetical protein